jgi:small subunit ribosomal protein S17
MAEEEKNEQVEETPEAEAPQDEAPEAEAQDAPAEEGEDAPAEEGQEAPAATGGEAPAADEADEEELSPKMLRKLERSRAGGPAKPQRTPEERAAERAERRRAAAAARTRYRRNRRAKRGEPGTGTPPAERTSVARKVRQGVVVSSAADKTITVRLDVVRRHPVYEKVVRRSGTVHAHDEGNTAGAGDVVKLVETRPLSRTKRWRLLEVVEKAK